MFPGKSARGEFSPKKFPPIKLLAGKFHPQKTATEKILTWNIPTHFINCLSSLNTSL